MTKDTKLIDDKYILTLTEDQFNIFKDGHANYHSYERIDNSEKKIVEYYFFPFILKREIKNDEQPVLDFEIINPKDNSDIGNYFNFIMNQKMRDDCYKDNVKANEVTLKEHLKDKRIINKK